MSQDLQSRLILSAEDRGATKLMERMAKQTDAFVKSFSGISSMIGSALAGIGVTAGMKQVIDWCDDYKLQITSISTALTGTLKETGKNLEDAYEQNKRHADSIFRLFSRISAKSLSSRKDLMNAYQQLTQRGMSLKPTTENLEKFAAVVDRIKEATRGQNSEMQVLQEIRAVLNGASRPSDALGAMLKARDKNYADTIRKLVGSKDTNGLIDYIYGTLGAVPESRKNDVANIFSKQIELIKNNIQFFAVDMFSPIVSEAALAANAVAEELGNYSSPVMMALKDIADFAKSTFSTIRESLSGETMSAIAAWGVKFGAIAVAVGTVTTSVRALTWALHGLLLGMKSIPGAITIGVGLYTAADAYAKQSKSWNHETSGDVFSNGEFGYGLRMVLEFVKQIANVLVNGFKWLLSFGAHIFSYFDMLGMLFRNLFSWIQTRVFSDNDRTAYIDSVFSSKVDSRYMKGKKRAKMGKNDSDAISEYEKILSELKNNTRIASASEDRKALADMLGNNISGAINKLTQYNSYTMDEPIASLKELHRRRNEIAGEILGKKTNSIKDVLASSVSPVNRTANEFNKAQDTFFKSAFEMEGKVYEAAEEENLRKKLRENIYKYPAGSPERASAIEAYNSYSTYGKLTKTSEARSTNANKGEETKNYDALARSNRQTDTEIGKMLSQIAKIESVISKASSEVEFGGTEASRVARTFGDMERQIERLGGEIGGTEEIMRPYREAMEKVKDAQDKLANATDETKNALEKNLHDASEALSAAGKDAIDSLSELIRKKRDEAVSQISSAQSLAMARAMASDSAAKASAISGANTGNDFLDYRKSYEMQTLEYRKQVAELERQINGTKMSEADYAEQSAEYERLSAEYARETLDAMKENCSYMEKQMQLIKDGSGFAGFKSGILEMANQSYSAFDGMKKMALEFNSAVQSGISDAIYGFITGTATIKDAFQSFCNSMIRAWSDMCAQMAAKAMAMGMAKMLLGMGIGGAGVPQGSSVNNLNTPDMSMLMAANGGTLGGSFIPFHAFATGGVASRPILGLIGEGRYNEAVVPLPDGRSIPVVMHSGADGAGAGGNVYVNVVNNSSSEVKTSETSDEYGNRVIDIVIDAVSRNRRGFRSSMKEMLAV